jgi:hypothetical protein
VDPGIGKRIHAGQAPLFTEVSRMIVCKAQYIEACVDKVIYVARRRAEQVTGVRVAAFLAGFAAVKQYALQIAEGHIRS